MGVIIGMYENSWEEHSRKLLSCTAAVLHKKKKSKGNNFRLKPMRDDGGDWEDRLVCVTSGVSYLGLAIVSRLLNHGYYVRLIVATQEELEKAREIEVQAGAQNNNMTSAVLADFGDVVSLCEAFRGCRGVFHTASLVDPSGLSGYSKSMSEIEVKACENVMEACARTCSVTKCVLTSSLLACIWGGDHSNTRLPPTINHNNWSNESICMEKKLWYALGKLRAEKAAWKVAERREFKLVTICSALVTGPRFCPRNPTPSIAYLKGAQEMYVKGLLATIDVNKLAEAHVCVYEAMNKTAFGRYICFDRVIKSEEEVAILTRETGMQPCAIIGDPNENDMCRFELSNIRLARLMSTTRCRNEL